MFACCVQLLAHEALSTFYATSNLLIFFCSPFSTFKTAFPLLVELERYVGAQRNAKSSAPSSREFATAEDLGVKN